MSRINKLFFIFFICVSGIAVAQNKQQRTEYYNLDINWKYSVPGIKGKFPLAYVNSLPLNFIDSVAPDYLFLWENIEFFKVIEKKYPAYEYHFQKEKYQEIFENYTLYLENPEPYSLIYFNGKLIGECDNNFKTFFYHITHLFREKRENTLKIKLISQVEKAKELYINDPVQYPSDSDIEKTYQYTRNPAIEYGWDFSPRVLLPELAQQICIIGWNDFIIYDQYIKQDSLTETRAFLTAYFEMETSKDIELNIRYGYESPETETIKKLHKGKHLIALPIIIKNPKLWWPNGLYQHLNAEEDKLPVLYQIGFEFSTLNQKEYKEITTGIKNITLIREKDSRGESFYFKVNNRKIFVKGANMVPQIHPYNSSSDQLLNFILNERDYLKNMNMIRIWGGGEYLNDEFYTQCDINGIMVWQDFMFANTMYPSDTAFLNNVKEEAEFQVKRLSRHPCIALWCGNNEIEVAWKNWGWQKKYNYTPEQIKELEEGYNRIFNDILPDAVKKYGNGVNYLSSSPVSNWGKPEDFTKGDCHYWGVWHGEYPIDSFKTQIPRFVSEYGFPSFPNIETIKKYFISDNSNRTDTINLNGYNINSPEFTYRMRSYKGLLLLWKYVNDYYGEPKDFESFLILTQMMQAEAYKMAIEAHRRAKPYCMGTMYWQLNDAWPGVSWSTVDYDGENKIAHEVVVDAYKEMIISPVEEKGKINIYVISDSPEKKHIRMSIKILDLSGKWVSDTTIVTTISADTSQIIYSQPTDKFVRREDRGKKIIIAELWIPGEKNNFVIFDHNYLPLEKPKNLQFPGKEKTGDFNIRSDEKFNFLYIFETYNDLLKYHSLLKKYNP
ncbi:MAG: glycosyl hydrolase 2 galactose-binding domain-containing protein [Bacteroidota bacterium]